MIEMSEQPSEANATDAAEAGLRACLIADVAMLTRGHSSRLKRAAVVVLSRGMQAVFLYRIAHACHLRRIPLVPFVLARLSHHLYAVDIAPSARIGPGLVLVHCFGTVVGSAVRIEGQCVLFHGVTLGDRGSEWVGSRRSDGHPVVGRGCMFGAGAKVLGPVTIGARTVIGANSVVISDVPDDSVAAGMPARVVNTRPKMNDELRPADGIYREDEPDRTADESDKSEST